MEAGPMPAGVETTLLSMRSADGARLGGVLHRVPGSRVVATLMHPRLDLSRHYLTSLLAGAGISVLTHGTRSVGNDLTLVHEQAVLDAAAGFARLRDLGFEHVVAVGASGGAPLDAFYLQQASRAPADRLATTPAGHPTGLADAELPALDGVAFVAAHPGQGELLLGCIDPAVVDEADPRRTDAGLDLFAAANGFAAPFDSSTYDEGFLAAYRAAQRARVERIDTRARALVAEGIAEILTVYRTDADPRTVDLALDPSDRPYGSVHGSRPHLGNAGVAGFGRLSTAEAWLSTWSGLSSNARFRTCAPEVAVPTLFVEYTG
jgi:hypothetical protein